MCEKSYVSKYKAMFFIIFFSTIYFRLFMPVLNFKCVIFNFSFIHLPISSDHMILILTIVECWQRKDVYFLIFA